MAQGSAPAVIAAGWGAAAMTAWRAPVTRSGQAPGVPESA